MTKPRLLVATDSYLPRWDGIARTLVELLPILAKTFDIRVLVPDYPGERPAIIGVTFVTFPLIPWIRVTDVRFAIVSKRRMAEEAQWADILWTHTAAIIGSAAIKACARYHKPTVSMVHSVEWDIYGQAMPFAKTLTRALWLKTVRRRYALVNRLITPGSTTRAAMETEGFSVPINVTPLGVSHTRFTPVDLETKRQIRHRLGLPIHDVLIGFLGRFAPEKDLSTLLSAHERLVREAEVSVLLVGGEEALLPRGKNIENPLLSFWGVGWSIL